MNRSNLLRRFVGAIIVCTACFVVTFSGCTRVDNALGSDLTLQDQSLKLGQMKFSGLTPSGVNYFESRLYMTDSIGTSSISNGYVGTMKSDTFGMRQAALYSQYIPAYSLDKETAFGFMPIYDSSMLYISVAGYGGDTSVVQRFEIFEVVDDSFISEDDSTFFGSFDMKPQYLSSEPIYTFSYPDQANGIYVANTTELRLEDTPLTAAFIERLMLINKSADYDSGIYADDAEWVENFKGIYIRPVESIADNTVTEPGAIYSFTLESTGFGFYGRNRQESDPTLIKDTIGMTYTLYSSYAKAGNLSINCIDHDYQGSDINLADVKTPTSTAEVPQTAVLRVSGMGGVVSEITFADEFFDELDTIFETEEADSGEEFTSLFFNQATLRVFMQEVGAYGTDPLSPPVIDPFVVVDVMDRIPTKLGLYTNYSKYNYRDSKGDYKSTLAGVADYLYNYESSYTLDFDGTLNRSWGCYEFNIPNHIQSIWNNYLNEKAEAEEESRAIDYDNIKGRTIYLAPTASDLFTTQYASLQAGEQSNAAPMILDMTYTMIR